MATASTTATEPRTLSAGTTVCWRMISGIDIDGRPIFNDWCAGTVVGPHPDDASLILVRRSTPDRSIVLVKADNLA
jgi:hypothetical protein